MPLRPRLLPALLLAASLGLAGCDSAAERAEKHYQSALTLLAQGDEERAMVELRNVFGLDGFHKEARAAYAGLLLRRGNLAEAYGQYLRLVEQYPDTPDVRRDLGQMALLRGDWAEVERHGREALRLAPQDRVNRALGVALDYRAAVVARDEAGRKAAAEAAAAMLAEAPAPAAAPATPGAATAPVVLPGAEQILRRVLIDQALAGPEPAAAMPLIEAAIAAEPMALEFHMLKLRLLAMAEDAPATGAHLRAMAERFPDNAEVKRALIGWYLAQRDIAGAEEFLRREAGDPKGPAEGHVAVVQLLQAAKGRDAARAELQALLAANAGTPNADLYAALLATLDFEEGRTAEAIAAIEAIVAAAQPSDQTRRLKVTQARMLDATGNRVGARARVEEVLAEDPSDVEALKLRASWRIQADDPGGAVVDLRAALDQAPRDPEILTLMAGAHEREGARDLAAERLALAVEVSGNRAEEALRYARFLLADRRSQAALAVLTDARRANPGDMRVLVALANLHLAGRDWPAAEEVAAALRELPRPEARAAAQEIRAALLLGQERTDEGLSFLSQQVGEAGDGRAVARILETMVRTNRTDEARVYLDGLIAGRPGDRALQMLSAALDALRGEAGRAEEQYRAILREQPAAEAPARMLYAMLLAQGRRDEAGAVVEAALAAQPKSGVFRWMKAGHLEKGGDIDGAIAVYEALYAEDSSNVIVANNLASLITTFRSDPESLERAYGVARRLRGTTVPAFADTYGWIAFRRGDLEEALTHLEPAAAGLPQDPLVQYHLGLTYAALGRAEDARRLLARAVEVAGPETTLPQIAEARAKLAELGGPPPAQP